jgi:general secretion pathway protein C
VELLGVIAQGQQGVALMSIDGQPARPYAVGNVLEGGRVLKAVGQRHAELAGPAAGSAVQRLEMPPVAPAEMPAGLTLVQGARP